MTRPYNFERGMTVRGVDYECALVLSVHPPLDILDVVVGPDRGQWVGSRCEPNHDHPTTRGLLLQQYRDRSGHAHAAPLWRDDGSDCGEWVVLVEPFDDPEQRPAVGRGPTEGEAIMDALTRLDAARQPTTPEPMTAAELADRLARIEARLRRIEDGRC